MPSKLSYLAKSLHLDKALCHKLQCVACLYRQTFIKTDLPNRSYRTIGDIVHKRLNCNVLTINEISNEAEWKPIIAWHKVKQKGQKWCQIKLASLHNQPYLSGIICTPDHELITSIGRVQAANIVPGHQIYIDETKISNEQLGALIGTTLGDGGLYQSKVRYESNLAYFKCRQRSLPLVRYKVSLFDNLRSHLATTSTITTKDKVPTRVPVYVCLVPHSHQLGDLYNQVIKKIKFKTFNSYRSPLSVMDQLNPIGLALWYMDDGLIHKNKRNGKIYANICALGFTENDQQCIAAWFRNYLDCYGGKGNSKGVSVSPNHRGIITFDGEATRKFFDIIGPHVIPEFRYKLDKKAQPFNSNYQIKKLSEQICLSVVSNEIYSLKDDTSYCISVKDNNNFLASKAFVANCPLNNNKANKYQHIEPHGSLNPDVLMLGLGPGSEETEHNQFFYGNSGQYLKSCITEDQHRVVRFNNVTRTRHLENAPPYEAVECCRPSVEGDIAATKPKLIIGLGGYPLSWVLRIPNPSIQAWRSHPFPVNIAGHVCWFYPTFHPAYVLRNFYLDDVFKRDIANAYKFLARGLAPKIIDPNELFKNCHSLYQLDVIEQALTSLYQEPVIAIDIETTPGRPYKDRAKIFSISVGTDKHTIAFPWQHSGHRWSTLEFEKLRRIFRAFIRNKKQKKIAHNAPFEIEWLVHEYDDMYIAGSNWVDTMSPGYCLGLGGGTKEKGSETGSEKVFRGLLSLDNMCRVFLGFWLKELSPVDRTNIEHTAIHDVLKYNSWDTASTYVLKSVIHKEIEYQGLQAIVAEHDKRVPTLALAQYKGLHCSIERAKAHSEGFGSSITKIFSQVNNDESVLAYRSRFSKFDIGAPADIASFFKSLGYNVTRKDRDGKEHISSDDEILKVIPHPVAKLVLEYRELSKLKSTYSDVFIPGVDGSAIFADGLIHTEFTSVFTTTGRTSSRNPNIQNLPARKHKEIRDIIVAPKGHILANCDAGQIEFRCIVMTCKDPKLIQYVWDGIDIHGEWAYKIARRYPRRVGETIAKKWMQSAPAELKAKDKLFKQWRDIVKNSFVFASLYGARPPRIAAGLNIPEAVAANLQNTFWEEFSGAKKWQDDSYRFYAKNGYIESLTGARRYGPLQSGEVINSPIQRVASDIVVDGMNRLVDYAFKTGKLQFIPVMNIHDDVGNYLPEDSWEADLRIIIDILLDCRYAFLNVPLAIEARYGPDFFNQNSFGTFDNSERLKERLA